MGLASINRLLRQQERRQQMQERAYLKAIRDNERARKAQARSKLREAKEEQRLYVEDRVNEVARQNEEIDQIIKEINNILVSGLTANPRIDFNRLLTSPTVSTISLGSLASPFVPPKRNAPVKPSFLLGWLPWVRKGHEARIDQQESDYAHAFAQFELKEVAWKSAIEIKKVEHAQKVQAAKADADEANAELNAWRTAFEACQPDAVAEYFEIALSNSEYPDGFPKYAELMYIAQSKQLIIEYGMPELKDVVPIVKIYKYVKAGDNIAEIARPEAQRRSLYSSLVAQTTLRCIWEVFEADMHDYIETVIFNGYVDTINPGTGKHIRPCLVTVRTSKDAFAALDLQRVEAIACLRTLNASFSKSPAEFAPVRPILELNMFDPRFVQESDVLSTLDLRPNLMDLTPSDFESLITNLFQQMGLNTKLTQASRDGGVDCVAFDPRPIFGGKVVIQAKRYKNTVGVSAVRDLFGTMQNEGASKGILVTTSGYGKAAFNFANGKPMELLDGGNLLYLLKEHSGVEAKIVMPDELQDIVHDNRL